MKHLSKSYRFETNPEEKLFHDAFKEECSLNGSLNMELARRVFPTKNGKDPVSFLTDREIQIVKNTVQWLGSLVGQSFLKKMGYKKV